MIEEGRRADEGLGSSLRISIRFYRFYSRMNRNYFVISAETRASVKPLVNHTCPGSDYLGSRIQNEGGVNNAGCYGPDL